MSRCPTTTEQDFLNLLGETHGLELTLEDLQALAEFEFYLQQQSIKPVNCIDADVRDGKVGGFVVGGLLGLGAALLVPGIGLNLAISIGASLGSMVGTWLSRPRSPRQDKYIANAAFNEGGSLVSVGATVPLIFGNRTVNPNGGVRLGGGLVEAHIETKLGAQKLFQLFVLGNGQLKEIDESSVLIDEQPRSNFFSGEIFTYSRLGTSSQTQIPQFPFYSQVVAPNVNAFFGNGYREKVKQSSSSANPLAIGFVNLRNCYVVGKSITKESTALTAWDAGAFSSSSLSGSNTWVEFKPGQTNKAIALGISTSDPDANYTSINYCIQLLADATWRVFENGVQVYTSAATAYAVTDVFRVEIVSGTVVYKRNGTPFYTSLAAPSATLPYFIDTSIYEPNGVIAEIATYSLASSLTGTVNTVTNATTLVVSEEIFDSFSPADNYQAVDSAGAVQEFKVVGKDRTALTLTASSALTLTGGSEIHAVYKAAYETTKNVSELHLNLTASVFARDEKGEQVKHGLVFDIWLKQLPSGNFARLGRFGIIGKNPNAVNRVVKIKNLPLAKYGIEVRPVPKSSGGLSTRILGDNGVFVIVASAITIGANTINYEIEEGATKTEAEMNAILSMANKKQSSGESGAPAKLTTINEVVLPTAIGKPATGNNYPGYPLIGYELVASERISSSPALSVLVTQGQIVRNLLAANVANSASTSTVLTDLTGAFITNGVQIGHKIRNLTKRAEATITAVTATTITSTALNWTTGDRYLVWSDDASSYFPDIFAFVLSDKNAGLGKYVDADNFIDYPLLVSSRRFCKTNNLYWDGSVGSSGSTENFGEWATNQAIGSLLHVTVIDNRFGLLPETNTSIKNLYNVAKVTNFKETYTGWSDKKLNSLIVVYADGSDGRFSEKSIIIKTSASAAGTIEKVEETLELSGVTNQAQAVLAGQIYFKSRTLQDRVVTFDTDIDGLSDQPGDLIILQHTVTEYDFRTSGFIVAAEAFNGGVQTVQLSSDVNTLMGATYKAAVKYKAVAAPQTELSITPLTGSKVTISGLTTALQKGDLVIVGEDMVNKNTYRISSVQPSIKDNKVSINATIWKPDILTSTGLVIT